MKCPFQRELLPPLFQMEDEITVRICCSAALPGNLSGITSTPGVSQQHGAEAKLHFAPVVTPHRCKSSPQGRCVLCKQQQVTHSCMAFMGFSSYSSLLRHRSTGREKIAKTSGCNSTSKLCCCSPESFPVTQTRWKFPVSAKDRQQHGQFSLSTTLRLHQQDSPCVCKGIKLKKKNQP